MLNYFTFNDNQSKSYGVYISGSGVFNAPERAYEMITIAGRNGDLIISQNRFQNIEVTYPAFVATSFKTNLENFRSMLMSTNTYARLSDTYNPDEFRAAFIGDGLEVSPTQMLDAGEFDITFSCKPQRFLTSGEIALEITSGDSVTNPTLFDARPVLYVVGYGQIQVGSQTITISNTYPSIVIDSEIMDCYASTGNPLVNSAIVGSAVLGYNNYTANANSAVTFSNGEFPLLKEGTTTITYSNTIASLTLTPRWWRL